LGVVDVVQALGGFEFDDDFTVDNQVGKVVAYHHAVIQDMNGLLLLNLQPRFAQIMGQSILIDLSQETQHPKHYSR